MAPGGVMTLVLKIIFSIDIAYVQVRFALGSIKASTQIEVLNSFT